MSDPLDELPEVDSVEAMEAAEREWRMALGELKPAERQELAKALQRPLEAMPHTSPGTAGPVESRIRWAISDVVFSDVVSPVEGETPRAHTD